MSYLSPEGGRGNRFIITQIQQIWKKCNYACPPIKRVDAFTNHQLIYFHLKLRGLSRPNSSGEMTGRVGQRLVNIWKDLIEYNSLIIAQKLSREMSKEICLSRFASWVSSSQKSGPKQF